MTAALRGSGTAPDGAGDDAGIALQADVDAAPGRPGPATRAPGRRPPGHSPRRSRRASGTAGGSAPASGPAGKHSWVSRGLLVTPWFAAATGFVIAASLWIYSPNPQFSYPAISIGKVPCSSSGCKSKVEQQGAGSLTMNSGQPLTQHHNSAAPGETGTRTRTSTAASGLTFGYVVRPAAQGTFQLIVSVTGKPAIRNWSLYFVLAGDHIKFVIGAQWQADGSDAGTARPFAGYQGQQHGGPGDAGVVQGDQGGYGYGHGGGAAHDQPGISFTVIASGRPPVPTDCSYDGASCTFHELSSAYQGGH